MTHNTKMDFRRNEDFSSPNHHARNTKGIRLNFRINYWACALLFFNFLIAAAQKKEVSQMFKEEKPLNISLRFSIKEINKSTNDTVYFPSILKYQNEAGQWDSLAIGLRARGNFRRKNCNFPPLRIKIKKKDAKNTLFEGNTSLKLVLPCQSGGSNNTLILKEYLCYQLYEPITPYSFNTRLLNITLNNEAGKSIKTFDMKGFFIEDDDVVAKRMDSKVIEGPRIHPLQLQDTLAMKHDFFQYLIANTDWSSYASHNIKVLLRPGSQYVPMAYDFDMSGLVDAYYATVNETLPIKSVRERLYRGFCRKEPLFQYTREQFLSLEPTIIETVNHHAQYFNPKELADIKKYLDEFFVVLKDDKRFKSEILLGCRTK